MADYFIGEIRPFALNFAPRGWMICNGATLPIQRYTSLFALIGTYYGGNGTTTFQIPNIQSQVLLGTGQLTGGSQYVIGEAGGAANVTIDTTTMPGHTHNYNVASAGAPANWAPNEIHQPNSTSYLSNLAAKNATGGNLFGFGYLPSPANVPNTQLGPNSIGITGGNQPHSNMAPFLTINYCIAVEGVFPARN